MEDKEFKKSGKWDNPHSWFIDNVSSWHVEQIIEEFCAFITFADGEQLENFFFIEMVNSGYFTTKE